MSDTSIICAVMQEWYDVCKAAVKELGQGSKQIQHSEDDSEHDNEDDHNDAGGDDTDGGNADDSGVCPLSRLKNPAPACQLKTKPASRCSRVSRFHAATNISA